MRRAGPIAALLFATLASVAFADEPTDPAELLRQAKQAETGDRDVEKALGIYRKIVETFGTDDSALVAGMRAAEILETQGKNSEALEVLGLVTANFGATLDGDAKLRIHQKMLRVAPEGASIRTPLGVVLKPRRLETDSHSPLDDKVRALVQRLDAVTDATPTYPSLLRQVENDLRPVGSEALSALARMIKDEGYERAKSAARLHASIGGAVSLPVLERIFREGDPFARAAAAQGFSYLPATPEVAAALGPVLDRVLADPALADLHDPLIAAATRALRPDDLMERHRKGGPHALSWLRAALGRGAKGAIARALEVSASGDSAAGDLEAYALSRININPNNRMGDDYYDLGELALDELSTLVDRLLPRELSQRDHHQGALLLLALARHADPRGIELAWTRFVSLPRSDRSSLEGNLRGQDGWRVPLRAFDDPKLRVETLLSVTSKMSLPSGTLSSPGYWSAVLEGLRTTDSDPERILEAVGHTLGGSLPPKELDVHWIEELRRLRVDRLQDLGAVRWIAEASARSGDPRFLAAMRDQLSRPSNRSNYDDAMDQILLQGFRAYGGSDRRTWIRDSVGTLRRGFQRGVLYSLGQGPEDRALLVELAGRRTEEVSGNAVEVLSQRGAVSDLVPLLQAEEKATQLPHPAYRKALVEAARVYKIREAAPFLLAQFRAGHADAAVAIDDIRAHYDRVASFETWVKGGGGTGKADLAALLADADPEIRRAAVLSLAALGDKESLPQLVRIAKDEKDLRVRQAALQAVERLAASPSPAPAPSAPPPQPSPAMGN